MTSGADARSKDSEMIGQVIAGRYVIERAIGRGGMGVVYLASQQNLDRRVVIKVLRDTLVEDDEAVGRFEREARGLSALQHPNIVTIHDFGHEDGQAYIVMEFIDGETISRRVRRDGPMPMALFLPIAAQILQGIGAAHSRGMLHRDIKPANIMLSLQADHPNLVKILDFGLAKLATGDTEVTKEHTLVGSAAFLAPEQIVGMDEVDQRVDVYALGVLFYYMLSGERPFRGGSDTTLLYKHIHEAPEPLAGALPAGHDVPERVIHLIHRCLAKNPAQRPADANDLLTQLTGDLHIDPLRSGAWSYDHLQSAGSTTGPQLGGQTRSQTVSLVRAADGSLQVVPVGNTSDSFSRDQSFILAAAPPRRSLLVPGLLVALLVLGASLGAYLVARDQGGAPTPGAAAAPSPTPSPTPRAAPDPEAAREQQRAIVLASLDEVDALISAGELAKASSELDMIPIHDLASAPELRSRAVEQRSRIQLEQTRRRAEARVEAGDLDAAIELYEAIAASHPEHEASATRLAALREQRQLDSQGSLTLSIEPPQATVTLDGEQVELTEGGTLTQTLPVGSHALRIEARGYQTHERQVTLSGREALSLDVVLERARRGGRARGSSNSGTSSSTPGLLPVDPNQGSGGLLPP